MMSPGNHGAAAHNRKHLRVLLPFTCDSLRIPDELAREIGSKEALIVVRYGRGVVQRVEVGQDGDGAFLGRGWPEFADACGVGAGWFVALRHHGGGVFTVKAFDASRCLRELATQSPAGEAAMSSTDAPHRPQFISMLPPDSMEKMLIPAKFLQNYIPKGHLNNQIVVLLDPLGRKYQIEMEMNQSGMLFSGGWSQFLALNGITGANCLLLRYEGNMVFTVKVFAPNGCMRESKDNTRMLQNYEKQQEVPTTSTHKCKSTNDWTSSEWQKNPKASISLSKASMWRNSFYKIGSPSWIKKVMNSNTLGYHLPLAQDFCNAIGLQDHCMITLKTSTDSAESWQLWGALHKNNNYKFTRGWRKFCQENNLKEGDMCTFHAVETTLWHVAITSCKNRIDQFCYQETPSASSRKRRSENGISTNIEQKKSNGPMASLNKASSKRMCIYELGPPAWIKKEINTSTIENLFSLPLSFCEAIGLREPCTITLKTSMSSDSSWQARVVPYKCSNHLGGLGWKNFCRENRIKEGDVCTFNVVETKLWHVVIAHQ